MSLCETRRNGAPWAVAWVSCLRASALVRTLLGKNETPVSLAMARRWAARSTQPSFSKLMAKVREAHNRQPFDVRSLTHVMVGWTCTAYRRCIRVMFQGVEAVLRKRVLALSRLHLFADWPRQEVEFFSYWMKDAVFPEVRRVVLWEGGRATLLFKSE